MKRFACGDVVPGCDATFVCDSEDDVLAQVAQHAADVHGMTEVPDTVVVQVREHIYAA
jgi:predicted small metal-binding protein